jgi:hypothetical protein
MDIVKVIMAFDIDFRVFHISGQDNVIADHLSRWRAADAVGISPSLRILLFQPPRVMLGAAKK